MRVTGVARGEHPGVAVHALGHIIKPVGEAVTDVVDRPPDHFLHIEGVRADDAVGRGNHVVLGELAVGRLLVRAQFVELDIHAEDVTAFAGQHQHVALLGRRDQTLLAHIGEVGVGQDVHHAPGLVGGVAVQLAANGVAHCRVRAIASHHIVGPHRAGRPPVHADRVLQRHRHRVIVGAGVDRQPHHLPAVVGLEPRGGVFHDLEEQLMQARLVDQDVRHLRAVIRHVLHTPDALDVVGVLRVGHPEGGLVDPVGFTLDLVGKAERLEHFHRARVDAVGLALDDVRRHALGDHRRDLGEP